MAAAGSIQGWEAFKIVNANNGLIALQASNGKYVVANVGTTNSPLQATASTISSADSFLWIERGNGEIALQAKANGDYVSVSTSVTQSPLYAIGTSIASQETFKWGAIS
jgi:hypothetical protein